MVEFVTPPISTDGDTLITIVGIDGQIPPPDMRVNIASELEFRTEPARGERSDLQIRFLDAMTKDEKEIFDNKALYAIKFITDTEGEMRLDVNQIERYEDLIRSNIGDLGFNIVGVTSVII